MSEKVEELVEIIQVQLDRLEEIGIDPRTHVPMTLEQLKTLIEYIHQLQEDKKTMTTQEQLQKHTKNIKALFLLDLAEDWETDHNGTWKFVPEWLEAKADQAEVDILKEEGKIVPGYLQERVEKYLTEKNKAQEIMDKLKDKHLEDE